MGSTCGHHQNWEAADLEETASSIITYWHKSLLQPIANGMNILHLACRTVPHSLGDPKTVARTHCCLPATSHLAT